MQHVKKCLGFKQIIQWFGTKTAQHLRRVFNQPHAPEFARVVKNQAQPVVEFQREAVVFFKRPGFARVNVCTFYTQVAAHAQVNEQGEIGEQKTRNFPRRVSDWMVCPTISS